METLPGPARAAREAGSGTGAEADPRIVPRRIVSLAEDRTIA